MPGLTVTEKQHWKDRIAARIARRVEAIKAAHPALFDRVDRAAHAEALRSLAAVCLKRYGRSVLADVIRRGVDPNCYIASLIVGVPLDQFMSWKDDPTVAEVNGKVQPLK
jgi:hypothetical protein